MNSLGMSELLHQPIAESLNATQFWNRNENIAFSKDGRSPAYHAAAATLFFLGLPISRL